MTGIESSNSPDSNNLTEADWDKLGDILESYSSAWSNSPPAPQIRDFVPETESNLRQVALVELIKFDLESRSSDPGNWRPLNHYQLDWPELCVDGNMPADLVYEELQIRRRVFGESDGDLENSAEMFPGGMQALSRLVRDDPRKSTALYHSKRAAQFAPGDTIDDFDLLLKLGTGAFASVFLARQNSMQRLVALKISADQGFEPQTLAQLDHPHIVRVFDHQLAADDGVRLMYMQYIAGAAFSEIRGELKQMVASSSSPTGQMLIQVVDQFLIENGASVPIQSANRNWLKEADWPAVVSHVGQQIASALAYAHDRNVLHRDLKPANVLLNADCNVKLVDFNVSFCSKLDGVTPGSFFGGSMAYMSPEQLEACSPWHEREPDSLTGKSDVYSLGLMLFELLTGERPFANPPTEMEMQGVISKMVSQRRRGLSDSELGLLADQPILLGDLIRRALASDEAERLDANRVNRWLAWSGFRGIESYVREGETLLSRLASRWSIAIVCFFALSISLAAALFITTYNLMESVPEESQSYFQRVLGIVNAVMFTVGGWIIVWLMLPIANVLKKIRLKRSLTIEELGLAMKRNWNIGHYVALMCMTEWTVAGFLFPIILTIAKVPLTPTGWFDFVSSHLIAGMIAGAYTFWSIGYFSLTYWQPRMMLASLDHESMLDCSKQNSVMKRRIAIYQVVAVSMPLLGIAWLIWWGRAQNEYAMGVVTLVALSGLGFLVWTLRQIQRVMSMIESLNELEKNLNVPHSRPK